MSTKSILRLSFDDEPDTFHYVSFLYLLIEIVSSSSPAIEILLPFDIRSLEVQP